MLSIMLSRLSEKKGGFYVMLCQLFEKTYTTLATPNYSTDIKTNA